MKELTVKEIETISGGRGGIGGLLVFGVLAAGGYYFYKQLDNCQEELARYRAVYGKSLSPL